MQINLRSIFVRTIGKISVSLEHISREEKLVNAAGAAGLAAK